MARSAKQEAEELDMTGLYKRGAVWWIALVRSPIEPALYKPLSTGTGDDALACRIRDTMRDWRENGSERQREWLHRAITEPRVVKLLDLYAASKRDGLETFGKALNAAKAEKGEGDLDALVGDWIEKDLKTREDCREFTKACYIKQVRFFIPEGVRFPKAKLTEQYVRDRLLALTGARADKARKVSGGTQRNYIVGLSQFVRYALRVEVLTVDPLRFSGGKHGWAAKRRARSVYHEFPAVQSILNHMRDVEAHAAMALIFGSGMELGGLLEMKRLHIGETLADGRGTVKVPGKDSSLTGSDRKNDFRSERTIFVDAWAWKIVKPYVDSLRKLPRTQLWSWSTGTKGKPLRDKFYRAQVAAGFIEEPPIKRKKMKSRGESPLSYPLWHMVNPHTIHDARHSYCINRSLGLDGEPPRSAGFCASQLGHGSEQMVHTVYKKAKIEDRVRTLQLAAAMEEAKRMVAAGGAR